MKTSYTYIFTVGLRTNRIVRYASFIYQLFIFNRNKPVLKHLNEVSRSIKKNVHNKF